MEGTQNAETIVRQAPSSVAAERWQDLEKIASVEVTSENDASPIQAALSLKDTNPRLGSRRAGCANDSTDLRSRLSSDADHVRNSSPAMEPADQVTSARD